MDEKIAPRVGHGRRGTAKFDDTMLKARNQADSYARAVSKEDGWPPFLMVVDVGHVIELYADFSGQGQGYNQFPDGNRYRIFLEDLYDDEVFGLLQTIWQKPKSLDPALQSAKVTRAIASHLAELGKSLEGQGYESDVVARFLMRCLFTMFAEDVELIPANSFTDLLIKLRGHPQHAQPSLEGLWETMNTGGFSQILMQDLKRFNGGLFKEATALELNNVQLGLLIEAATADWKQVEPAIFGTLLERALSAKQRHKLGAHYTPRSYVERLVTPTVMEPLRSDWRDVQTAVQRLMEDGKPKDAIKQVIGFHKRLCDTRVLDPACGSGNFLYVTMEHMKRLEGEVVALVKELGGQKHLKEFEYAMSALGAEGGRTVDPHQFLGIELNPWAAAVAELVLWIGYLQWHFRTFGNASPSEPVLRDFKNIENRDALMDWKDRVELLDNHGNPEMRYDGVTKMRHPVTGEEVPDPSALVPVYKYVNPSVAKWPEADFIVGNPPFIGLRNIRKAYADGYLEALRSIYPNVPENSDYVMYWWEKAALLVRAYDRKKGKGARQFGLITTNSISQSFNRAVTSRHIGDAKSPLSIMFAVPDHPWVDATDGAAVRIAMTVGMAGNHDGRLNKVTEERETDSETSGFDVSTMEQIGAIYADLKIGPNLLAAKVLKSNEGMSSVGYQLTGKGFLVLPAHAKQIIDAEPQAKDYIHPWTNGMGIQRSTTPQMAIDVSDLQRSELKKLPNLFQHLSDHLEPTRKTNAVKKQAEVWWRYARPRDDFRPVIKNISRMIVTTLTASHRVFVFMPSDTIADSTTVMFGLDDAAHLAVLSSRIHIAWTLAQGGTLEDRPRYNKSRCFDPFPFPAMTAEQAEHLRKLGEDLDAHRKRQQKLHLKLTLTEMYNVVKKLKAGEPIEGKDKKVYDQALVGVLMDIHDQIDEAVAQAYGWDAGLDDEDILYRLVELNKERVDEELSGNVRYLRPAYQNPAGKKGKAAAMQGEIELVADAKAGKADWPKTLPEQIAAVRGVLSDLGEATPEEVASHFKRARVTKVQPLLESLAALGQAELRDTGEFAA